MPRIAVANLIWRPHPRVPHGELAWVVTPKLRLKVAGLIDENANPLKARGSPPLARPFTLELYFPLPAGVDRVRKFTDESAARADAANQLAKFVASVTEIM